MEDWQIAIDCDEECGSHCGRRDIASTLLEEYAIKLFQSAGLILGKTVLVSFSIIQPELMRFSSVNGAGLFIFAPISIFKERHSFQPLDDHFFQGAFTFHLIYLLQVSLRQTTSAGMFVIFCFIALFHL